MRAQTANMLVLFPGALGDFVCLLPTLAALRREGRLTVAAKPALVDLLPHDVGRFSIDRREIADLFSNAAPQETTRALLSGFTRVLSWTGHGHDGFAARLRALSRAEVAVHPFRDMRRDEHASRYYARCARVAPVPWRPALPGEACEWATALLHGTDTANTLVIHAGSGSPAKNWTGFGALAQRWRAHGHVLWVVGPADDPAAIPSVANIVRDQPLPHIAALVQQAPLYAGNDSGISHLAGFIGARGVALFGASDPITWAPLGLHVLRGATSVDACGDRFCTHRLSVDLTYAALRCLGGSTQ